MKLTKSTLKEMIREVIKEEKQLNEYFGQWVDKDVSKNYMDYAPSRIVVHSRIGNCMIVMSINAPKSLV